MHSENRKRPRPGHPRLLVDPAGLARLRALTASGPGKRLLDATLEKARRAAGEIAATADLRARLAAGSFFWPKPGHAYMWSLHDMALAGTLAGDRMLLNTARRLVGTLTETGSIFGGRQQQYYIPPLFIPLAYDLLADALLPDERARFSAWAVREFIRGPLEVHRRGYLKVAAHNMTVGAMEIALATLLAVRGEPGAPRLEQELERLLLFFRATLHVAIGPDGYPEEDIGYGTVVVPGLLQVAEMLRRAGLYDAYAECPHLARFGRAMLHFVQPWGEALCSTGDHGDQLRDREFALARLAALTRDPTLLWLLGTLSYAHGRTFPADLMPEFDAEVRLPRLGNVPATALSLLALPELGPGRHPRTARLPTAFRDRARGIVSFRSGWGTDDSLLIFDGSQRSPGAPGHFHDSGGHFSFSALGEYFAIDGGRYNVDQEGHNVVLIDGRSGRSTGGDWRASYYPGRLTGYRPGPFCDFASADSSHQHNCLWAWRSIGLVKGRAGSQSGYVWIAEDINKDNDWAEFHWMLNTSPENRISLRRAGATIRGWRQGNLLDVEFVLPAPDRYPRPHALRLRQDAATTAIPRYVPDPASSARAFARPADMRHGPVFVRPRLRAEVSGYNGRFMALLIPRAGGAPRPRVEPLKSLDNSLAARVVFDDVEDLVIVAYEHRLLEAADVRGVGDWCVVRRVRRGGRLVGWAMGEGTALSVGGKKIRQPV